MRYPLLLLVALLIGCGDNVVHKMEPPPLPDGLADCQLYRIDQGIRIDQGMMRLFVMRCPNSTTGVTHTGKNPIYTVTIDGTKYEEVVAEKKEAPDTIVYDGRTLVKVK